MGDVIITVLGHNYSTWAMGIHQDSESDFWRMEQERLSS